MISYNVPLDAQRMTIGVQGEDNVRQFLFDVSEWRALTGDIGTAEMVVQRRGDSSPYAAAITMHDENTVSWVPTAADTAKAGAGKIQLMWIAIGQTVKTKIFDMKVEPALDYQLPDDSLDPWASWVPDVINAAAAVGDFPGTVAEEVAGWLEENIGPTTPAIDQSLSIEGAGADAKVTGEKVAELKSALDGVTGLYGQNLFNPDQLLEASGWTESDEEYSGTFGNLLNKYNNNASSFSIDGGFKENTQYSIRFQFYTNNTPISSGNIINFRAYYSDGTDSGLVYLDVKSSWTSKTVTTASGKTITKLVLQYSNSNGANNLLHLRYFQIAEGAAQPDYEPYQVSAIDLVARDNDLNISSQIDSILGYSESDFEIGNIAISDTGWIYSTDGNTTRVRTKQNVTINLKVNDVIRLNSYDNARYYVGWRNAGGVYSYAGWLTTDFNVYEDGEYVILLCNSVDTVLSSKYELLNLLRIDHSQGSSKKSIYDLPWFNNGKMRLQAHKGLIDRATDSNIIENSVNAFEYAGVNNIFLCETDVRRTSDGHYVCIHDATVDATTDGTGTVANMTLAEIRTLKLLRVNGTTSDLPIPTIEEYLTICKKYNMVAGMELKDANVSGFTADLVGIIKKYGMENQSVLITSAWTVETYRIRQVTDLPLLLIANDAVWEDTINFANSHDYVGITYDITNTITQEKIDACHNARVPFDVFTETDMAAADNYFNMGVDLITTPYLTESDWKTLT